MPLESRNYQFWSIILNKKIHFTYFLSVILASKMGWVLFWMKEEVQLYAQIATLQKNTLSLYSPNNVKKLNYQTELNRIMSVLSYATWACTMRVRIISNKYFLMIRQFEAFIIHSIKEHQFFSAPTGSPYYNMSNLGCHQIEFWIHTRTNLRFS